MTTSTAQDPSPSRVVLAVIGEASMTWHIAWFDTENNQLFAIRRGNWYHDLAILQDGRNDCVPGATELIVDPINCTILPEWRF